MSWSYNSDLAVTSAYFTWNIQILADEFIKLAFTETHQIQRLYIYIYIYIKNKEWNHWGSVYIVWTPLVGRGVEIFEKS